MKLFATVQGEKQKVEIVELHEKEEKVTVKLKDGKKYKVGLAKLSLE
jgi:ABC-type taurine transport system ATPase subunit